MPFALLLALLLPLSPDLPAASRSFLPDTTTALADTTEERKADDRKAGQGVEFGFRLIPTGFYSASKGFGVGGALVIDNLIAPGTELILSAQPMQRYHRYRASFFTGDPFYTPLFAGFIAEYESDQVRGFYGIGPQSSEANKIYVSLESVEAEARVGWHPLRTSQLLVQPVIRLLHHNVRSFQDRREDAFLNLDPASQRTLFDAVGEPTTGLTYGLEVALDGRDRLFYSTRGALLLLTARRYDGLGDGAFRYYAGTASLYGFAPLPRERHVLFARAVLALTRQIGDEPLPFYALPVLDDKLLGAYTRYRFNGNDLLVLTAGYRFPVFTLFDWFGLDGNVSASIANAYDDIFEQFEPGVAFGSNLRDEGGRTPLRPAVSAGVWLVNLAKDRVVIAGQVGVDPEGYRFGSLRLVYGIRDIRPLVR